MHEQQLVSLTASLRRLLEEYACSFSFLSMTFSITLWPPFLLPTTTTDFGRIALKATKTIRQPIANAVEKVERALTLSVILFSVRHTFTQVLVDEYSAVPLRTAILVQAGVMGS